MPILCPICPTPLPSGLQLVRRGLGWRDREEHRETKKRERDVAEASRKKKVLSSTHYPPEPMYIPNHEDLPPTVAHSLTLALENSEEVQPKQKRYQDRGGQKDNHVTFR